MIRSNFLMYWTCLRCQGQQLSGHHMQDQTEYHWVFDTWKRSNSVIHACLHLRQPWPFPYEGGCPSLNEDQDKIIFLISVILISSLLWIRLIENHMLAMRRPGVMHQKCKYITGLIGVNNLVFGILGPLILIQHFFLENCLLQFMNSQDGFRSATSSASDKRLRLITLDTSENYKHPVAALFSFC